MPADKYGFKPVNGAFMDARSFGEQVNTSLVPNYAFFNEIEKKEPPRDCAGGGPSPQRRRRSS